MHGGKGKVRANLYYKKMRGFPDGRIAQQPPKAGATGTTPASKTSSLHQKAAAAQGYFLGKNAPECARER